MPAPASGSRISIGPGRCYCACASIQANVARLQRSRAPIQQLADQVSGWFVPIVLLIALASLFLWVWLGPEPRFAHGLVAAVAVLIIACPCALGLATPMSIMVGVGKGAAWIIDFQKETFLTFGERVRTLAGGGGLLHCLPSWPRGWCWVLSMP